ncbi:MAG: HAD family hydrolase [Candidatus ainarchaeum sp.]|nr:HAD family hydrolase [Candidatus ainarchaeum sp.]
MAVKAVFLDIDDTLFPSKAFAARARRAAVRAMVREGAGIPEKRLCSELERAVREFGSNYPGHFNKVLRKLKVRGWARYSAAGIRAYHDEKDRMRLFPGARRALLKLKRSGVRLFVASEGVPVKQWDKLIRLGVSELFDSVLVSRKKSEPFFRRALSKARVSAREAVMVGDKLEKDAKPALKAGMGAVLVCKNRPPAREREKNLFFAKSVADLPGIISKIG